MKKNRIVRAIQEKIVGVKIVKSVHKTKPARPPGTALRSLSVSDAYLVLDEELHTLNRCCGSF